MYSYHKRIKIFGLENIPTDKPVLFLPNHQSALIDVLLIATNCKRKPYFLTRADVFSKPVLKRIFKFFRMLPIYRIRDGRKTLSNNALLFNECAELLKKGEAIVVFPEANHNLMRRVRPLSKGFTRIILRTFEVYPNVDIQLVPVGFNYKNATYFPDEVHVYYGEAISSKSLFVDKNLNRTSLAIKDNVYSRLKELTTHIPEELDYDVTISSLIHENANFLNPKEINGKLNFSIPERLSNSNLKSVHQRKSYLFLVMFMFLNLPITLIWKMVIKPKVPEKEFMGTFRFATGLILYPVYLLIILLITSIFLSLQIAFFSVLILTMFNLILVKYLLK